jgi:hypothetical protein
MPDIKRMDAGIFIILTIAVLNIFDFTIAKEPIQFLYFLLMYAAIQINNLSDKTKTILILAVSLVCALTFRNYYALLVIFAPLTNVILGRITNKKISRKKSILISLAIIFVTYLITLLVLKMVSNSLYTQLAFARTRSHSNIAETQIRNVVATSNSNAIVMSFELLLTAVRLVFPIELINGSPKYYLFIVYQLLITSFAIRKIMKYGDANSKEKMGLCVLLGFVLMSALFEPDFGSWIRHEAVLFPVIMLTSGIYKTAKGERSEKI